MVTEINKPIFIPNQKGRKTCSSYSKIIRNTLCRSCKAIGNGLEIDWWMNKTNMHRNKQMRKFFALPELIISLKWNWGIVSAKWQSMPPSFHPMHTYTHCFLIKSREYFTREKWLNRNVKIGTKSHYRLS